MASVAGLIRANCFSCSSFFALGFGLSIMEARTRVALNASSVVIPTLVSHARLY
jgi:hypothetical protein